MTSVQLSRIVGYRAEVARVSPGSLTTRGRPYDAAITPRFVVRPGRGAVRCFPRVAVLLEMGIWLGMTGWLGVSFLKELKKHFRKREMDLRGPRAGDE